MSLEERVGGSDERKCEIDSILEQRQFRTNFIRISSSCVQKNEFSPQFFFLFCFSFKFVFKQSHQLQYLNSVKWILIENVTSFPFYFLPTTSFLIYATKQNKAKPYKRNLFNIKQNFLQTFDIYWSVDWYLNRTFFQCALLPKIKEKNKQLNNQVKIYQ